MMQAAQNWQTDQLADRTGVALKLVSTTVQIRQVEITPAALIGSLAGFRRQHLALLCLSAQVCEQA
jgi:hypothetical protein